MKRPTAPERKGRSRELIGEMMLAKSVLEEKSELLEQKEAAIRRLCSRNRELEAELEELRGELKRCARELKSSGEKGRRDGIRSVVAEVVRLVADYEAPQAGAAKGLALRVIRLFQESYGLEVVENAAGTVDPQIHQVIVAEGDPQGGTSIQVLRKGFRLEGTVIRPALVKVVERRSPGAGRFRAKPDGRAAGGSPGL